MKHARDDYNRIQDPAGKIGADEHVRNGGALELAEMAEKHADAMEAWQQTHSAKPADLAGLNPRPCGD